MFKRNFNSMWQRLLLIAGGWYLMKKLFIDNHKIFYKYYFDENGDVELKEECKDCKEDEFFIKVNGKYQKIDFESDFGLLVRLVYCEARGEPFICKKAIAQIVIDRFYSKCYANRHFKRLKDVIYDTKPTLQFGCIKQPSFLYFRKYYSSNIKEREAFLASIKATYLVFYKNDYPCPKDLLFVRSDEARPDSNLIKCNLKCSQNFYRKPLC